MFGMAEMFLIFQVALVSSIPDLVTGNFLAPLGKVLSVMLMAVGRF